MTFYTVYVGNYVAVPDCKKDQKKLNDLNLRGYVFSMGEYYSLRVGAYISLEKAKQTVSMLQRNGLKAFIQ